MSQNKLIPPSYEQSHCDPSFQEMSSHASSRIDPDFLQNSVAGDQSILSAEFKPASAESSFQRAGVVRVYAQEDNSYAKTSKCRKCVVLVCAFIGFCISLGIFLYKLTRLS